VPVSIRRVWTGPLERPVTRIQLGFQDVDIDAVASALTRLGIDFTMSEFSLNTTDPDGSRVHLSRKIPERPTVAMPVVLAEALAAEPIPHRSVGWNRHRWCEAMHDLPDVLAALSRLPSRVDRGIVREIARDEIDCGRTVSAFVCAMVWSFGTAENAAKICMIGPPRPLMASLQRGFPGGLLTSENIHAYRSIELR